MTPLNRKTFLLVKQHFAMGQPFTTEQLAQVCGDTSKTRKRSLTKILYDLYKLGILHREVGGRAAFFYRWTEETDQVFTIDAPRTEKPFEPAAFDREHREWVRMVEQRKLERENLRERL